MLRAWEDQGTSGTAAQGGDCPKKGGVKSFCSRLDMNKN